jgi:small GTP-binding protein
LQPTIGVELETAVLHLDDRKVKLTIWDTAGLERFQSIAKSYYRNAVGIILVFDVSDRISFDDLPQWLNEVHSLCDPNAIVQLIRNKSDQKANRLIIISEAEDFASHHKLQYLETSAKLGENVKEAFVRVATTLMNQKCQSDSPTIDRSAFALEGNEKVKSSGCC